MSSDLAKRTEVIDMPTNCQTKICCLRKWVRKPESSITMTTLGPGYTTEVPFTRRCTHWHTGDLWAFGQLPPQGNRKWAKQSPLSLSTNGTGKGDSFPPLSHLIKVIPVPVEPRKPDKCRRSMVCRTVQNCSKSSKSCKSLWICNMCRS